MSFQSSFYVKDNDIKYGLKVVSSDPKTSKVHGLWVFRCNLVIHRLTSIWSRTSTRLSFMCTKNNQSWSMVSMRSPKSSFTIYWMEFAWSSLPQSILLLWQCCGFLSMIVEFVKGKTCFVKCFIVAAWCIGSYANEAISHDSTISLNWMKSFQFTCHLYWAYLARLI